MAHSVSGRQNCSGQLAFDDRCCIVVELANVQTRPNETNVYVPRIRGLLFRRVNSVQWVRLR